MNEIGDEVMEQLFDKLDSDNDGKVSFEEMLQGMFQQQQESTQPQTELSTHATSKKPGSGGDSSASHQRQTGLGDRSRLVCMS